MAKKVETTKKVMDTAERVRSRADETELSLSKDRKVMFMIPLGKGEKPGSSYHSVTINGFRTNVPKGKMVEIPEKIANLLAESYNVSLGQKRVDRSAETIKALS
jgi:hypothetical protein